MQSHKTLRSLVLAVTSLVAVVIVFAVYRSTQPGSSTVETPSATPTPTPTPTPAPTEPVATADEDPGTESKPDRGESNLNIGSTQVPIGGGSELGVTLFDQEQKQRGRLKAKMWRPLDGNRYEIIEPVIILRTPGGQVINVSADQGLVELTGNDPQRPDPKKGTLTGHVNIVVDRLSDEQRDALPPAERYQITDERRIKIEMEDITFDLEYSRIQTERSFSIESIEAKIAGTGLLLHYNELDSRIEELVVREGREIEVVGFGGAVDLSGDSAMTAQNADATGKPSTNGTPPTDSTAVGTNGAVDPDLPIVDITSDKDDLKAKPKDEYIAVFEGDVHVLRLADQKQIGEMLADRLQILFDFGAQERQLAKQTPGERAGATDASTTGLAVEPIEKTEKPPVDATTTGLPEAPEERVRLTWTGPLRVTSRRPDPSEGLAPDRRRAHITATGEKVEVRDDQRTVLCKKLIYQEDTGLIELYGTEDEPAFVEARGSSSMRGVEIKLDQVAGHAYAKGPGRLISTRSLGSKEKGNNTAPKNPSPSLFGGMNGAAAEPERFEVRFGGDVNATFGKTPFETVDPETGETITKAVQSLHRAHFTGGVDMRQNKERIECDRIDIDFALNGQGEIYPVRAHAIEDVTVSQEDRYIKAKKELIADLDAYAVEKPPFELEAARKIAVERGLDPDAQDWTKIERDYNSEKKYRTGLSSIYADGTVSLRDPAQELEVDCERLTCKFKSTQEIESGVVTPQVGQDAFVGLGEFSIAAPTDIIFSAAQQSAKVEGSGKMTFLTDRDFDGRKLKTPTLVRIMWQERMDFEGQKNVAHFSKKVHVSTDASTYDCDHLRVDFADAPKPAPDLAKKDDAHRSTWWIFTPLIESASGQAREDARFKISGPSFNKDPIFVQATGHVVGVNRNFREGSKRLKSRVQMKGPSMSIDLREKYVRIDGKGNMLIEDYRPPKNSGGSNTRPEPKGAAPATPFGGASRDEPSQTYLGWASTMNYRYDVNIAQLDKDVQLVHRSGAKMKMAAEILGAREAANLKEGRVATLDSQSLVVQFIRTSNDNQAGAGRLSGTEVQSFNASGQVYFVDSGISAVAQQITYSRDDSILQIIGSKDEPAQLFDERGQFRSQTGPRFEWDRRTNTVRARNSYGRMN